MCRPWCWYSNSMRQIFIQTFSGKFLFAFSACSTWEVYLEVWFLKLHSELRPNKISGFETYPSWLELTPHLSKCPEKLIEITNWSSQFSTSEPPLYWGQVFRLETATGWFFCSCLTPFGLGGGLYHLGPVVVFDPYLGKWSNLTNMFRWVETTT